MEKINIQKFRKDGSKVFSGRNEGISARKEVGLEIKDQDSKEYTIIVPVDTYTITSSFFGGMFSDSVIFLGEKKFRDKYRFAYTNGELNDVLLDDIDEGISDALK